MLLEPAIVLDQAVDNGRQSFAVMLVPRIGVVKYGELQLWHSTLLSEGHSLWQHPF
jgi:hypothetical protein